MAGMMYGIKRRALELARKAMYIKHYRAKASGQAWMKLPIVKEIDEKTRKNVGAVGGDKENPGNRGTFSQVICPPIGGDKNAVGGVGSQESGDGGQRSEVGGG